MDEKTDEENDENHDHGKGIQEKPQIDGQRAVGKPPVQAHGQAPVAGKPGEKVRGEHQGKGQGQAHGTDGHGGDFFLPPGRSEKAVHKDTQGRKGGKDPQE